MFIHLIYFFQDKSTPKVQVNDYVQIYGNIKTNKGKKLLMAFKILPITDVNIITFHYLQCINNKVKMESDSKKVMPTNIQHYIFRLLCTNYLTLLGFYMT
jgi:hypothetical protein